MYKRLVDDALRAGRLSAGALGGLTDEGILHAVESPPRPPLLDALRERRLYKRSLEVPAAELGAAAPEWIAGQRELVVRVEDALALELGLAPGELLLDFPAKTQMLGLDITVLGRDGARRRLTSAGWPAAMNLPRLADELYRTARWLRVFTVRRMEIPAERMLAALLTPPAELAARLDAGASLLG
jgi:hypothetical protein